MQGEIRRETKEEIIYQPRVQKTDLEGNDMNCIKHEQNPFRRYTHTHTINTQMEAAKWTGREMGGWAGRD